MVNTNKKSVVIFAIQNTFYWWKCFAESLSDEFDTIVITEHKTDLIHSLKDRYYYFMNSKSVKTKFSNQDLDEIWKRCRVLRSLQFEQAKRMIIGFENAYEEFFSSRKVDYLLSFPIDRYPMDVLERVAKRHGAKYLEVTVCLFKNTSMLLKRGVPLILPEGIPKSISYQDAYDTLISTSYKPVYVTKAKKFTKFKWIKRFIWQYARSIAFKGIMLIENDFKGLHYLDSQMYLKHKVSVLDINYEKYIDWDYQNILVSAPKSKNVILALQLYPEASIDYWVNDLGIVDYEPYILSFIEIMSKEGYNIFLKDHPLQFGFRQLDFIQRAKMNKNVYFLPYESDINQLVEYCGISMTTTGTVGLQSALKGLISIVTPSYYSNDKDFIIINSADEIAELPMKIKSFNTSFDIEERRNRIINHLYSITLNGDIFSFHQRKDLDKNESLKDLIEGVRFYLKNISE